TKERLMTLIERIRAADRRKGERQGRQVGLEEGLEKGLEKGQQRRLAFREWRRLPHSLLMNGFPSDVKQKSA
ncbi:hypothetical protein ONJ23_27370, partial [Salmonella enterica subsp. enterica serovar Virginia]|nr:hypothetical protein [Salmonella enterica subsp. enterica serovar Virginia]